MNVTASYDSVHTEHWSRDPVAVARRGCQSWNATAYIYFKVI